MEAQVCSAPEVLQPLQHCSTCLLLPMEVEAGLNDRDWTKGPDVRSHTTHLSVTMLIRADESEGESASVSASASSRANVNEDGHGSEDGHVDEGEHEDGHVRNAWLEDEPSYY